MPEAKRTASSLLTCFRFRTLFLPASASFKYLHDDGHHHLSGPIHSKMTQAHQLLALTNRNSSGLGPVIKDMALTRMTMRLARPRTDEHVCSPPAHRMGSGTRVPLRHCAAALTRPEPTACARGVVCMWRHLAELRSQVGEQAWHTLHSKLSTVIGSASILRAVLVHSSNKATQSYSGV